MRQIEDIQRYLDGSMSVTESADFERQVAEDARLAAELEMQKRIHNALLDREARAFRQTLQSVVNQETKKAKKRRIAWSVAALTLLAGLIAGGWYYRGCQQKSPAPPEQSQLAVRATEIPAPPEPERESPKPSTNPVTHSKSAAPAVDPEWIAQVYREQLEPTVNPTRNMSASGVSLEPDSVEVAFFQHDYNRVLQLVRVMPPDHSRSNFMNWMAAHAAYHMDECESAEKYARLVQKNTKAITRAQQAELFLLLIWTKCGQNDSVKFKRLLKACAADKFHPAYSFALDYSKRIKPAQ